MVYWQYVLSGVVGAGLLAVPLWNYVHLKRLSSIDLKDLKQIASRRGGLPKVSIMIPMRDEAHNMVRTLPYILSQDYSTDLLEVILIDDNSTDGTRTVCQKIIREHNAENYARVINGKKLADNWMGKSWALHQAEQVASGDLYIFFDADVEVSNTAVSRLVCDYYSRGLDMLSCFPNQIMKTIGEKLTVPIMTWGVYGFIPIALVESRLKMFSSVAVANGQTIVMSRTVYENIGGHEALRTSIVDDVSMARLVKSKGLKLGIAFGSRSILCRMYDGFKSGAQGFTRSIFRGSFMHPLLFLILFGLVFGLYLFGIVGMFFWSFLIPLGLGILFARGIVALTGRDSLFWTYLLYPVELVMFPILAFSSFAFSVFGNVEWKGRSYSLGRNSISVAFDLNELRERFSIPKEMREKFGERSSQARTYLLSRMKEMRENAQEYALRGKELASDVAMKSRKAAQETVDTVTKSAFRSKRRCPER